MPTLDELLLKGDLDGLVREVDRLCALGEFDAVLVLRDRCNAATEELGKQLWGAAQYAEYRVALEAPGPVAASVVLPGAARFALGPLTEVVAQQHVWEDLADHLDATVAPTVAQERIVRGEDLTDDPRARLEDLGLPGRLQPWEPSYPLPTYRATERLDGGPPPPRETPRRLPADAAAAPAARLGDLERALRDLVSAWVEGSGGEARVVTIAGDVAAALATLWSGTTPTGEQDASAEGHDGSPEDRDASAEDHDERPALARARLVPLSLPEALARMAWAGASGGARGRRRGMAAGRSAAWWVGHTAGGVAFPADPDELEFRCEELAWYAFDDGGEAPGWRLRLAVEDPGAGWAAAIDAVDRHDDNDADEAEEVRAWSSGW